jgi:amino acid permease
VNELKEPSQSKFNLIAILSIVTAWTIYLIVASRGYITYGDNNTPDLLQFYPETTLTALARFCISAIVVSHFPLQAFPCRKSILSLIDQFNLSRSNNTMATQDATFSNRWPISIFDQIMKFKYNIVTVRLNCYCIWILCIYFELRHYYFYLFVLF